MRVRNCMPWWGRWGGGRYDAEGADDAVQWEQGHSTAYVHTHSASGAADRRGVVQWEGQNVPTSFNTLLKFEIVLVLGL